ncbi:hypothetical protein MLD38_001059 [Melastoma candidum]|uniref:Uncharacterized protein n=1 Tax=Melastoma candidum TaxID=119954 RepID=A0ACB9SBB6_9MYRT|nr:hypothetical protein MLD38_001059 [Melastoma candidum]
MLRFRPIAPKPFNGVAVPLPSLAMPRSKRKYVARRRNPPRGRIRRRATPKPLVLKKQPLLFPGKVVEPSTRTKARDGSKAAGAGSPMVKSFSRERYEKHPGLPPGYYS